MSPSDKTIHVYPVPMALPLAAEATAYERMIFDRQDACDACDGKAACAVWRMAPCGALLRQVGMTCPSGRWPTVRGIASAPSIA